MDLNFLSKPGLKWETLSDVAVDYDFDEVDLTFDGTWRDLDLSAIIPGGTKAVVINCRLKNTSVPYGLYFRHKGDLRAGYHQGNQAQVVNQYSMATILIGCDSSGVIQYYGDVTGTVTCQLSIRAYFR